MNDNDDNERRASEIVDDMEAASRHRAEAGCAERMGGGCEDGVADNTESHAKTESHSRTDRRSVLEAAEEMSGDRGDQYGGPEENMAAVCRLWNAYIDNKANLPLDSEIDDMLEPSDVSQMMVLLKMARCQTGGTDRETLADEAGYVRVCAETKGVNGR